MGNLAKPFTRTATELLPTVPISTISGQVQQIVYTRVDTKVSYSAIVANIPARIFGTEMALLTTTILPKVSNSQFLIELNISFEMQNDTVFRLLRSVPGTGGNFVDVLVGNNSTDSNRWSGWGIPGYDVDDSTTPRTNHYMLVDQPLTSQPITYRFLVSSSDANIRTLQMNRTTSSAGADSNEVGISQVIISEIAV